MKRYTSIFELAAELDAEGFEHDKDIYIPACESADADPNAGTLTCSDGILYNYPKYKAYYIYLY